VPRRPPAVARVLERVTTTAREHEMFGPGDLVLVSCSGGPDSVCLLYSLWHLRRLFSIRLAVFHFDHKLRSESAKDTAYVKNVARRLNLPLRVREADDAPLKGESIEAWAREARQTAARAAAEDIGATRIAEGHTVDDQAETVLMAAIKGSGLHGLVGILPNQGPKATRRVQPLIDVSRDDVEGFCRALGLRPRRDPTNADTNLLRNAIRLEGIPALERATGREIRAPLARIADEIRPIFWERPRDSRSPLPENSSVRFQRGEWVDLSVRFLEERSSSDAVRLVRGWLKEVRLPVSKEAIDAVLDLAKGRSGRKRDLPRGLKAVRDKEYVRVSRSSPPSPEY
jgi:tRNA(Ile)-lysidine synthetase-like protein